MVYDRQSHIERHVRSRKGHSQESEAAHRSQSGGPSMRNVLCILCLFVAIPSSFAQAIYSQNQIPARGVSIEYTLTIANPTSHLYDVQIQVKGIQESSVSVSLPAWSPGMYRIENYARNVQDFRAANARNQSLKWEKTDKQTWRVAKPNGDDIEVRY